MFADVQRNEENQFRAQPPSLLETNDSSHFRLHFGPVCIETRVVVQTAILCHTFLCVAQGNQSMQNSSIPTIMWGLVCYFCKKPLPTKFFVSPGFSELLWRSLPHVLTALNRNKTNRSTFKKNCPCESFLNLVSHGWQSTFCFFWRGRFICWSLPLQSKNAHLRSWRSYTQFAQCSDKKGWTRCKIERSFSSARLRSHLSHQL